MPPAGPARAQPAGPKPLDEGEFLARFRRADPRFAVLAARVEGSRAELIDAGRLPNPALTFDREEVFDSGDSLPEHILRLEVPIDISGRRGRSRQAAQKGIEAARAETGRESFLLLLDAADVYHDAAAARLRAQTLRDGRDALAALVDVVRARKSAGDASGYELGRLDLELAAYDDLIAEADIELARLRRLLAALVGEPDAIYDASDPLELPTIPAAAAGLAAGAVRGRGDHQAALLRVDQADRELAAARRSWIPGLIVSGGLKTVDLGDRTAAGYVAGLAIELPLFDRGQGAQARSRARKREQLATARAIERQALGAVQAAREELARRIEQARLHDGAQVARLADLLRRAQTVYREGDRPIVELLDAHRTAREVRLRSLQIRREARRAQTALFRALGHR